MSINRHSRRIERGGRDWTAPAHLSDWQRDRADPQFATGRFARRELLGTIVACVALWVILIAVVIGISVALS